MTDGKRGHQFFHTPLAKGAFHFGIGAHHKLFKFVAAVFAVIFIHWHGIPPYLQVVNTKISPTRPIRKSGRLLIRLIFHRRDAAFAERSDREKILCALCVSAVREI
jgi:hypothetical protein